MAVALVRPQPCEPLAALDFVAMSEKELQEAVLETARALGWLCFHTHDSRRSQAGFPDLVLVHRGGGLLIRELKTAAGKVSPEQAEWLKLFKRAGVDVGVWRPDDWTGGAVERELRQSTGTTERASATSSPDYSICSMHPDDEDDACASSRTDISISPAATG